MTATELSAIAGIVLSLAFSYLPGVSSWFDKLDPTRKRLTMAVVLLVASSAIVGLSCAGVLGAASCDQSGVIGVAGAFIAALVANQSAYLISPQPKG